jgi:acyl carrier protein
VTHLSATPLVAERLLGEDALPLAVVLGGDDGAGPALVDLLRSKVRAVETLLPAGLGLPPVCDGTPPPGVSLDVVDDRGRPLPVGVVGEVRVRVGTSLRTGALLHAGTPLRTGHLARVRPDGRLDPMGPLGPYRTRELLALDPSVLDCRVAESASTAGGRRLVGHVRTLPGAQWDPDAIRRRLAERRLPRPLIPDVLVQVAQWPLDAAGTVDGALLPAPDEAAEPVDPAAAAQGEPWDEEFGALLRGALAEAAWTGDLDPDVPLADAGLGSMATVGLMVAIEQLYDLVLPDDFQIIDMFRTPRTLWQDIRAFRDAAS